MTLVLIICSMSIELGIINFYSHNGQFSILPFALLFSIINDELMENSFNQNAYNVIIRFSKLKKYMTRIFLVSKCQEITNLSLIP